VGALLVRWMLRRTHRRLCATTEQWLDPGERVTDVAVGNRTWTLWPWAGGMALMLASVVALSRTSGPLGVGLFLAAWVFLLAPVLTVPSIVLVATSGGRVVVLDASPFRSVPRGVRASLPVADLDRGKSILGARIVAVAGTRLWVGSFWVRHLPARRSWEGQ